MITGKIDISGLDKAAVLAALYNASRPLGMGFLNARDGDMSNAQAADLLSKTTRFDYLYGRVMKVDLSGDEFDSRLYDRDNGQCAALCALVDARIVKIEDDNA